MTGQYIWTKKRTLKTFALCMLGLTIGLGIAIGIDAAIGLQTRWDDAWLIWIAFGAGLATALNQARLAEREDEEETYGIGD